MTFIQHQSNMKHSSLKISLFCMAERWEAEKRNGCSSAFRFTLSDIQVLEWECYEETIKS